MKSINKAICLIVLCWCISTAFSIYSIWWARESNLWDINIRFCNDKSITWWTKSLELSTQTNKEEEICLYLNNGWPTALKVGINFVDGTITPDQESRKACEPEWAKTNFGQYVQAQDTEFLIQPWETLQTFVKLKFPSWVAWLVNGCVTSNVIGESLQWEWMLKVFSRRANFIDVLVSGDVFFNTSLREYINPSLPNISKSKEMSLYHNMLSKNMSLKSRVVNSWNLSSTTVISWSLKWWFGLLHADIYNKTITTSSNKHSVYEYDLPKRALLWGPLVVNINASHSPVFPSGFDNRNLLWSQQTIILKGFVLPWWIYVTIWVLIIGTIINHKLEIKWKKSRSKK